MTPESAPVAIVERPDVRQKHAILDHSAEILHPPFGQDRADHHLVERRRVLHVDFDAFDLAALDRVEPLVAVHHERPRRTGADQDEVGMHEVAQPIHVAAAQGITPFAFQSLDQLAALVSQAGVLSLPHPPL